MSWIAHGDLIKPSRARHPPDRTIRRPRMVSAMLAGARQAGPGVATRRALRLIDQLINRRRARGPAASSWL
jgi:hypothetical protein